MQAVDLKCMVRMLIKIVDSGMIISDNCYQLQHDFNTEHVLGVILHILRYDVNSLHSCEKINQLVFDLDIFGILEKALSIIDTKHWYSNPLLDKICKIIKCILVNGSSDCMNAALPYELQMYISMKQEIVAIGLP